MQGNIDYGLSSFNIQQTDCVMKQEYIYYVASYNIYIYCISYMQLCSCYVYDALLMCIYVLHFIHDIVQLATYQEWWKQTFGGQLRPDIGYMVYSTFYAFSTTVNFGLILNINPTAKMLAGRNIGEFSYFYHLGEKTC